MPVMSPFPSGGPLPSSGGTGPALAIRLTPDQREFAISTVPAMPQIAVQVVVVGVQPDPTAGTAVRWRAILSFDPRGCRHGVGQPREHARLDGTAVGGRFTLPFRDVRGGALTIRVSALVDGRELRAERSDLRVVGTNPRFTDLAQQLPTRGLRALVWRESGGRQFDGRADGGTGPCPLYSGDMLGGVGLMQVTRPAPTLDQTWSWRANVAAGVALYREKERVARGYPRRVRDSAAFRTLVTQHAAARRARGAPPLDVTLPDFTAEQLELDTLRGYNGYAGADGFLPAPSLHEFRVARDAAGALLVREEQGRAVAQWERVPANARPRVGDPNYVDHVLQSRPPF
jgi:hypothetical protein